MERIFKIKQRNASILIEIISGIIVFFSLCYIAPLNASILASIPGVSYEASFVAISLCSGIFTILMGIFASYPLVISAGIGINAYFTYSICGIYGYSFNEGLLLVFISSILLLILTFTPIRQIIINSIPLSIRQAVSTGLGAFICFVGLKNAGIITSSSSTLVTLGDFKNPTVLLALFGIIIVLILMQFKGMIGKLAIPLAICITAILGFILHYLGVENMPCFTYTSSSDNLNSFKDNVFSLFKEKDAFINVISNPISYVIIFNIALIQLFDSSATLIAVGKKIGFIDENDKIIDKKVMYPDAIGTLCASTLGVPGLSIFAESTISVENGSKTGLTSLVTGLLFILSIFIYPVFSLFSTIKIGVNNYTPVTSLALVSVGCIMFKNIKEIDWNDKIATFTTFLIVILMVLTYSISDGLGLGLIFYSLMMIASKRAKEVSIPLYFITVFYIVYFGLKIFL